MKIFTPEESSTESKKEDNTTGPLSEETQAAAFIPGDDGREVVYPNVPPRDSSPPSSSQSAKKVLGEGKGGDEKGPIETVLQMPAPESVEKENERKPPHLQTPPYVHHFDTYTLVQQVEAGGFTMDQSVTAMKAVRGLLAQNLDVAREGLVSKSDVENVSFLLSLFLFFRMFWRGGGDRS